MHWLIPNIELTNALLLQKLIIVSFKFNTRLELYIKGLKVIHALDLCDTKYIQLVLFNCLKIAAILCLHCTKCGMQEN